MSALAPAAAPAGAERPVLLIADREPAALVAGCRYLDQVGFTVHRAGTSSGALEAFEFLRPDAVVLDAALPGEDGFTLCRAIRSRGDGRDVPIVLMTDRDDYESTLESSGAGASDVVTRPVNWLALAGRLQRLVEADRARRAKDRADERIWQLSNVDALTGLPNRSLVRRLADQALARWSRTGRMVAALYLDVDRFAEINQSFGASTGDALLVEFARRLERVLRRGDTLGHPQLDGEDSVARLSGDEFLVLMGDLDDAESAGRAARRMLEAVTGVYTIGGEEVFVSASAGIAVQPPDGADADTLLEHAAAALSRAKSAGRGGIHFYTETINASVSLRLALESGLRRALDRGELALAYQPLVEGVSGRITGCEALLRWTSHELGPVPPSAFISIAEESGLIVPIGAWVLETACRQARAWRDAGLDTGAICVNVSSVQLANPDFEATVARVLAATGLPPGALMLELTESALIKNEADVVPRLLRLRALGVNLVIDDFGAGYTALRFLKRFPVQAIKIDGSFIEGIARDASDSTIVSALIAMSRGLRLKVVAEGVETEEQYGILRREGCDQAQGYLFSRPLPADAFAALARASAERAPGGSIV